MVRHLEDCTASQKGKNSRLASNKRIKLTGFEDDSTRKHFIYSRTQLEDAQIALATNCNIPFSTFDSPDFHDFCKIIRNSRSNKDLMSRKALSARVHTTAAAARLEFKDELKANKSRISISLDGWTSPNNIPFMEIVAHFIDNKFCLRREILSFDILPGSHTGETLTEAVWHTLKFFGVLNKVNMT